MLENLVRPFQDRNSFATQRVVVATSKKQPPQTAQLIWGAAGILPTAVAEIVASGVSLKVDSSALNTELYRITAPVRIENPDNSSDFVIASRISAIGFTKPQAPSTATTSTVDQTTGATTTTNPTTGATTTPPATSVYILKNP